MSSSWFDNLSDYDKTELNNEAKKQRVFHGNSNPWKKICKLPYIIRSSDPEYNMIFYLELIYDIAKDIKDIKVKIPVTSMQMNLINEKNMNETNMFFEIDPYVKKFDSELLHNSTKNPKILFLQHVSEGICAVYNVLLNKLPKTTTYVRQRFYKRTLKNPQLVKALLDHGLDASNIVSYMPNTFWNLLSSKMCNVALLTVDIEDFEMKNNQKNMVEEQKKMQRVEKELKKMKELKEMEEMMKLKEMEELKQMEEMTKLKEMEEMKELKEMEEQQKIRKKKKKGKYLISTIFRMNAYE